MILWKKVLRVVLSLLMIFRDLSYDEQTIKILKKYNTPFIIQHMQGTP